MGKGRQNVWTVHSLKKSIKNQETHKKKWILKGWRWEHFGDIDLLTPMFNYDKLITRLVQVNKQDSVISPQSRCCTWNSAETIAGGGNCTSASTFAFYVPLYVTQHRLNSKMLFRSVTSQFQTNSSPHPHKLTHVHTHKTYNIAKQQIKFIRNLNELVLACSSQGISV